MNVGNQREHIGDDRTAMTTPDALAPRLRAAYDIVVCGSGPGGSVAARRLADQTDAQVLLVEAGGSDDSDAVAEPITWPTLIGRPVRPIQQRIGPNRVDDPLPMPSG